MIRQWLLRGFVVLRAFREQPPDAQRNSERWGRIVITINETLAAGQTRSDRRSLPIQHRAAHERNASAPPPAFQSRLYIGKRY